MPSFGYMQLEAWKHAEAVGFHEEVTKSYIQRGFSHLHSEVAEAWKAYDDGKPKPFVAEELADIVIMAADIAQSLGIALYPRIEDKIEINKRRTEYKHGKQTKLF